MEIFRTQGRFFINWAITEIFKICTFSSASVRFSHSVVSNSLWLFVDCSMSALPVHHQLLEPTQTHVHHIGDAIQPSHPQSSLLLLPSIFPSIRVFSSESVLHVRWPKYCPIPSYLKEALSLNCQSSPESLAYVWCAILYLNELDSEHFVN